MNSFQEARLAMDQIVRDVNDSGFPPPAFNGGNAIQFAISPFAWSTGAGYSGAPCKIGTAGGRAGAKHAAGGGRPGPFPPPPLSETEIPGTGQCNSMGFATNVLGNSTL